MSVTERLSDDRGSAVVDFTLTSVLLLFVFLAVFQLGLALQGGRDPFGQSRLAAHPVAPVAVEASRRLYRLGVHRQVTGHRRLLGHVLDLGLDHLAVTAHRGQQLVRFVGVDVALHVPFRAHD